MRERETTVIPASTLAEYHGVSESYLLKHLKALVKAGILETRPGPKGGYRLARDPDTITFLDIVEAVEGKTPAFRCTEIRRRGPVAPDSDACRLPCGIHAAMREAEDAWRESLRGQIVGEMARDLSVTLSARRRAETAAWLLERARPLSMVQD